MSGIILIEIEIVLFECLIPEYFFHFGNVCVQLHRSSHPHFELIESHEKDVFNCTVMKWFKTTAKKQLIVLIE